MKVFSDSFYAFKGTLPQLFAGISGTLFAISDGMTYGWTAPFIPYLISEDSHIDTNEHEAEWLEATLLCGSLVGLPLTIYLVDKIGRKKSLLFASFIVLVAWIMIAFADRMHYIFIARFLCGMAGNMAFVAAPMYMAEIADQKIRGFLSSIIYIMMLIGCLTVYCVGPYLPFYVPCIIGGSVALIEIVIFSTVPESSLFLMYKDRPDEARKSLEYFKPYSDIEKEMQIIRDLLEEQKNQKGRIQDLVSEKSNRKAIIIMAILNFGQHFSAYTVIIMNLHLILEAAGSIYMESSLAAIVFAALMLIAAIFGAFQVDKYGRRFLLTLSSILTGMCLLTLAIYFHVKDLGFNVLQVSWIPIVSVMVYAVTFKIGIGLVPIVITAEIFPTNLKALGMTIADGMFMIGGIAAINLYQYLNRYFGMFIPFYIFATYAFFLAIFSILVIPETKGKSLEEIQCILKRKNAS